jgi:two-component system cell cycle sensor histidine kinase/response regulator CckA
MPEPLRVLFAGQTGPDVALLQCLKDGSYDPVFEVASTAEAVASALAEKWDIGIAQFEPGKFGAIELLEILQQREVDLPTIVISGRVKETDVVRIMRAGAADHIPRTSLSRLCAAVARELRSQRLRRESVGLEEQFRQAQKMEAVGRLAGGVAHDFNNLLTVITGYSDLLLSGKDLKDTQRTALEEIRRAAERGGALTHQLLAFSRRQPMQAREVRMNDLLMQIQKLLGRLIGEDISLVVIPAASRDTVHADAGRIEQVIMNLVVNARDAMPGGGTLTLETATVELSDQFSAKQLGVPPGPYVMLSITDTGVGMDKKTLDHVFEPFFTTKPAGRGTGLGLATAYGIIRQSGGAIHLTSEAGAGTTAWIHLPLTEPKMNALTPDGPAAGKLTGAETILLVEDEARVRKLIRDVLRGRGYRVLEATRGEEAIRICAEHGGPIDLVVVDVVMPEMSGPDVVKEIRLVRPDTLVLYMSGYTDEAIVHHRIPESGAAFLAKPFMPDALSRKVREVLDSRANSAE